MGSGFRFVACLAIGFSIAACAAKLKHVEVDSGLSRESLARDGLAVLGCTSVDPSDSDFEISNLLTSKLVSELREEREGVKIVAWGDVRSVVGDSLLQQCLGSVREYGSIKQAELDSLALSMRSRARYPIVHRIVSNETYSGESDAMQGAEKVGTDVSTTRVVTVEFAVYDLDSRKRVWNGTIEGKSSNQTTYTLPKEEKEEEDEEDSGGVVDFVAGLFGLGGDDDDAQKATALNAPAAPSLKSVMDNVYSEFADELFKED